MDNIDEIKALSYFCGSSSCDSCILKNVQWEHSMGVGCLDLQNATRDELQKAYNIIQGNNMTIEEKRNIFGDYCARTSCSKCALNIGGWSDHDWKCPDIDYATKPDLDRVIAIISDISCVIIKSEDIPDLSEYISRLIGE